jgi:hypothetical protein
MSALLQLALLETRFEACGAGFRRDRAYEARLVERPSVR